MSKIEILYLKELDSIEEIVIKKSPTIKLFNLVKLFLKKIIGSITIKENGIAVIPYKNLRIFRKIKIYFIRKVLEKLNVQVVLSKRLNEVEDLKRELLKSKINVIEGNRLASYIFMPIIDYICKMKRVDIVKQEITILVKNYNERVKEQILELSVGLKRINVVTTNLKQFQRLEEYLEENLGIGITITNNKRKSLLKSEIIINIDFDEETLNMYNINRDAIIININNNIEIRSKLFNGINVYDYQIIYDNYLNDLDYKSFDKKALYESIICNKNYTDARKQIKRDNLKIVNLMGKNGIINIKEFLKV